MVLFDLKTFIRRARKAGKLLSEGKYKSVLHKLRLAMQRPLDYTKSDINYMKLYLHYRRFIDEHKRTFTSEKMTRGHDRVIWWCWLQGVDDAPEICKACLASLRQWYPEYKIITLSQKNIPDYITLPDYIQRKYEQKLFSRTHYSDLVRLELLNKYGGAWIDSTVYVTGRTYEKFLRLPLFALREVDPKMFSVSPSWFLVSDAHNPVISLTHDLMFRYWEENDSLVNYFLIYMMFRMAVKAYPEEWKHVPVVYEPSVNKFMDIIFDEYSEDKIRKVEETNEIHKLHYALNSQYYNPEGRPLSPSSVYGHLISRYKKQ